VAVLEADGKIEGQEDFIGMRMGGLIGPSGLSPCMDGCQSGAGIGPALSQAS